jgi:hypothetical protein
MCQVAVLISALQKDSPECCLKRIAQNSLHKLGSQTNGILKDEENKSKRI